MEGFQGEETFQWGLAGSVEIRWPIKVEKPTCIGFPKTLFPKALTPEQSYKKLFPITSVYLSKNKDKNDQTSLNPGQYDWMLLHFQMRLFHLSFYIMIIYPSVQFSSVQFSCSVMSDSSRPHEFHVRLFATPWIAACQASLSITNSQSSLKLMSFESVIWPNHLILCRPLLLRPPIPPNIRVFSIESTLHIR